MDEDISQSEEEALSQTDQPIEAMVSEDDILKNQMAADKDKYVRLLAEFDNMRKRNIRERAELIKYAHEEVIVECLKLYDDLQRSLQAFKAKEGIDVNLLKGLEMVYANLKQLMDKYAVKPMETLGKPFDPSCHEVLIQEETTDFVDGVIMEVFEEGYTLAGRVVRTAKVKVAKNSS